MTCDGVEHILQLSVLRGSLGGQGLKNMDRMHTNALRDCTCILVVCWFVKLSGAYVAAIPLEEIG